MTIRPYSDIRILDLTYNLGRYTGRLFADLGAEVIRVEPPEGLPDRAADLKQDFAFEFFAAGRKGIVLDFGTNAGRERFASLMRSAHAVLLERGGPFTSEAYWLREINPTAVITVISPFGLDGTLEDAPSSDLVLQAAGGIAWMTGRLGEPPLRLPLDQSVMVTSTYAAMATGLCIFDAETNERGHFLDVSAQECIAHSLQNAIQVFDLEGRISNRGGQGTRDCSEALFACKDGLVFCAAKPTVGKSWKSFVDWVYDSGHPSREIFVQPEWQNRAWRLTDEAKQRFKVHFEAFLSNFTKQELTDIAVERRLLLSPVNTIKDVLADPQLAYRNYFVPLDDSSFSDTTRLPGPPYNLSQSVWRTSRAPRLGEHTSEFDDVLLQERMKS